MKDFKLSLISIKLWKRERERERDRPEQREGSFFIPIPSIFSSFLHLIWEGESLMEWIRNEGRHSLSLSHFLHNRISRVSFHFPLSEFLCLLSFRLQSTLGNEILWIISHMSIPLVRKQSFFLSLKSSTTKKKGVIWIPLMHLEEPPLLYRVEEIGSENQQGK